MVSSSPISEIQSTQITSFEPGDLAEEFEIVDTFVEFSLKPRSLEGNSLFWLWGGRPWLHAKIANGKIPSGGSGDDRPSM
jgi:hypothetical protein